jgi:hypothetical protein
MTLGLVLFAATILFAQKPDAPPPTANSPQTSNQQPNSSVTIHAIPGIDVKRDWMDRASLIVGILLVVVGAVTGGLIWYQAKKTAEAAEATQRATEIIEGQTAVLRASLAAAEKSAGAALLNAQAVINSERPWLVVEAEGYPEISFKMTNKGKTPAQLIQYDPIPKVITPLLGETMGKPVYGKFFEEQWQILNEPMIFPEESRPAGSYSISILKNEAPELWDEIATVKKQMYIYSAIKYKGPFTDDIYETAYCYLIWQGAKISGDYGYNRNT